MEGSHDRGSEDRVLPVADQLAAMTAAGGDGVGGADAAQNDAALRVNQIVHEVAELRLSAPALAIEPRLRIRAGVVRLIGVLHPVPASGTLRLRLPPLRAARRVSRAGARLG